MTRGFGLTLGTQPGPALAGLSDSVPIVPPFRSALVKDDPRRGRPGLDDGFEIVTGASQKVDRRSWGLVTVAARPPRPAESEHRSNLRPPRS
jgi:hypothetical protein